MTRSGELVKSFMRFSDIQYIRPDLDVLKAQYEQLACEMDMADPAGLLAAFSRWVEVKSSWRTAKALNQIRYFQDTGNTDAKCEKGFFDDNEYQVREWDANIMRRLLNHPHRLALEERYGHLYFSVMAAKVEVFDPKIAEYVTDEERLLTEQVNVVSQAGIGAPTECSVAEQIDCIYDRLVKTRDEMAKKLGYQNYIKLGYKVTGLMTITPRDVEGFRDGVRRHIVPWLSELHRQSIPIWQRTSDPVPRGDWQFIVKQAAQMFREMSPEMSSFFDTLLKYELFDLDNRGSMREWGEAFFLPDYRMPFIFYKSDGGWGDVMEFIHECGHAFMFYCLADDPRLEYLPTAEAHEIHGMALHYLASPWLELFFGDDADICRYSKYFGRIYGMVFFCCIDEFEHFVYNNPTCGPEERNRFWIHLEEKYGLGTVGDGSSKGEMEGRGWQDWEVIFSLPLYSIGYALSEVVAQQLWMKASCDRKGSISDYINFCKASASKSFPDLLEVGKLRSPFQRGILEELVVYGREWVRKHTHVWREPGISGRKWCE